MSPDPTRSTPVSDDDLVALLATWMPSQRWYAGKGQADPSFALEHRTEIAADLPGLGTLEQLLVAVTTALGVHRYQVWVAWTGTGADSGPGQAAVIGAVGDRVATDALLQPAVAHLLLQAIADGADLGPVEARPEPDAELDPTAPGKAIGAEQSNTSIVYGSSSILKVFRRLEPGPNPDVEIHRALHAAGSSHVAVPLGTLSGPVGGEPTTLGLLTRFYANSAEGWAMAVSSVRDLLAEGDLRADEVGGDFAAEASRLGEAVAAVHRDLAVEFGTTTADKAELAAILSGLADDARRAATIAPSLLEHLDGILSVYELAAEHAAGLDRQRIHGDLHLGQTLRTLTGWVIIDFEGEPDKPLAIRRQRHSPLRDVAGMLRSFDYAAHFPLVGARPDSQHNYRAAEWTARNSTAFCDGYSAVAGVDPRQASGLLRAFELEKAVYEVVYEHGHRPNWEGIPLQAVSRLVHAGGPA
jgi:maltokinase